MEGWYVFLLKKSVGSRICCSPLNTERLTVRRFLFLLVPIIQKTFDKPHLGLRNGGNALAHPIQTPTKPMKAETSIPK